MLVSPIYEGDRSTSWLLDSGASGHMCDKRDWFLTYQRIDSKPIRIGDGRILYAIAEGNINVLAYNGYEWKRKFLSNVLHVPELKYNLFSMGAALQKDIFF